MIVMSTQHRVDARGLVIPYGDWPIDRNAPDGLEVVRRFINTQSFETGADLLSSTADVKRWAAHEGVARLGIVLHQDLDELHDLRRLLRASIESHTAPTRLRAFSKRHLVELVFEPGPGLCAPTSGIAKVFSAILVGTWFALHDDTWGRLTSCSNDHCRWIVFDSSKSKTVRWCSDDACGGRVRAQRYRDRRTDRARSTKV